MKKPTLIFASNNPYKVDEIKSVIGERFNVLSLKEAGINVDIPEPYDTLEENASEKSVTIHRLTRHNCFSEDTGLEVEALNGEPGVRSARYAGAGKNFKANIDKLLNNLLEEKNRKARFRTVISLIWNDEEFFFEGISNGKIIDEPRGTQGFGYDPVFVPHSSEKTYGEMNLDEKNKYSHRRKAAEKLIEFLNTNLKG